MGEWWNSVKQGTKNLDIPVLEEVLLFGEGVLGAAGSLISSVFLMVVDLGQLLVEVEWMVLDEAGKAIKEDYIPKVGEVFDRYGPNTGRFTSPVIDGKPFTYDQRSLPYLEDASKYHQYEVIGDMSDIRKAIDSAPLEVKDYVNEMLIRYKIPDSALKVQAGKIAPAFGVIGGGIQWQMPLSIDVLEDLKLVKLIK